LRQRKWLFWRLHAVFLQNQNIYILDPWLKPLKTNPIILIAYKTAAASNECGSSREVRGRPPWVPGLTRDLTPGE
jgi:hypothetical protein